MADERMAQAAKPYTVTRSYDGKSADARRHERRQQLLQTGIHMIGQNGYADASLNAICAQAGLSKRYFYESFDSVDALLTDAFLLISQDLQQAVLSAIGGQTTPAAMIRSGFRAFFEYLQAHPCRARVFLMEALSVQAVRSELLGGGGGVVSPFLLATTLQLLQTERLAEPVLNAMAQGAVGAAIFVGQNWIANGYTQPVEELVQAVSEICFGIAQRLDIPLDLPLESSKHS